MSENALLDAVNGIDEEYLNEYFKAKLARSRESRAAVKRKALLKWLSAAACLALTVTVVIGICSAAARRNALRSNGHSQIKLFTDGEKLYFYDARTASGVSVCDPSDGSVKPVLSGQINSFELCGGNMFYETTDGVFMRDASGAEKQLIASIQPGSDADGISTGFCDFIPDGDVLYFLTRSGKQLRFIDHTEMGDAPVIAGEEYWSWIYRLELENSQVKTIRSTHDTLSFISQDRPLTDPRISQLHLFNGRLYYTLGNEIRSIGTDGGGETTLYRSSGPIVQIYWDGGLCYIARRMQNGTDVSCFHTVLSVEDGEIIFETSVEPALFDTLGCRYFDKANGVFYSVYEDRIIRFRFDAPQSFEVVHTFAEKLDAMQLNLIVIGGEVYYSRYSAISPSDTEYRIFKIENGAEIQIMPAE